MRVWTSQLIYVAASQCFAPFLKAYVCVCVCGGGGGGGGGLPYLITLYVWSIWSTKIIIISLQSYSPIVFVVPWLM